MTGCHSWLCLGELLITNYYDLGELRTTNYYDLGELLIAHACHTPAILVGKQKPIYAANIEF